VVLLSFSNCPTVLLQIYSHYCDTAVDWVPHYRVTLCVVDYKTVSEGTCVRGVTRDLATLLQVAVRSIWTGCATLMETAWWNTASVRVYCIGSALLWDLLGSESGKESFNGILPLCNRASCKKSASNFTDNDNVWRWAALGEICALPVLLYLYYSYLHCFCYIWFLCVTSLSCCRVVVVCLPSNW